MDCPALPPAAEIRCLDQLNMRINRDIRKLIAKRKPCPEVPEDPVADCDCFAERKARELKSMGYDVKLRAVYIPRKYELHRVVEWGDRVFDNRYTLTEKKESLTDYVWVSEDLQVNK